MKHENFLVFTLDGQKKRKKGQINTTDYDCHKYINVLND